jgi:uncharacterized membrane protein YhaH (DUF805 family)
MNTMTKYFEFSGTINGLNYFLRNLLASIIAMFGGFVLGFGLGSDQMGLVSLGLVILVPALILSFATIYKRMKALFSENASEYSAGLIMIQILTQFIPEGPFKTLASLVLLIFGLILIFKNSGIENHEG